MSEQTSKGLPDFGMKSEWHDGVELQCRFIAPGLTLHDLVVAFEDAKAQARPGDEFASNPSRWPEVRGIIAVRNAIVRAIYGEVEADE